jgi:serine/threonine-protein kinase
LLTCPTCKSRFEGEEQFCPRDGSPLAAVAPKADRFTDPALDPLIGRVLGGRYRLAERLGQGGMGTVYRATHTLMDKPVAVKILRGELATDAEAVARFHREARSASRLDHDHCIRVTDFGQSEDGLLYLAMELLDGISLGQVVRRGPLAASRAAAIGLAIAEALAHAHEQGIIHRDLKPDNVFLARRNKGREIVKVLDFGLAKLASDSALGPSITRDGTVFGTPEYMAPEQAEGEKLDGRTDIYALGIMLYQLLTGKVPFSNANFVALLTMQVTELAVPPREARPDLDIPPALELVVLRCIEKRAEDRYPTAAAFAEALEPFAAGDAAHPLDLPTREPGQLAAAPEEGASDSELADVVRPRGRRVALVLGVIAMAAASAAFVVAGRARLKLQPPVTVDNPSPESTLQRAKHLLTEGDLDGADKLLKAARQESDSAELQEAMSEVAEQLGNRLGALAHMHRATSLAPDDPEPRARLAALLLRLGQPAEACRQARAALALSGGPRSSAARSVLVHARCANEHSRPPSAASHPSAPAKKEAP